MRTFALTLTMLLLAASAAEAGSICGIVRDAETGDPVARAGIFLRYPTGEYAGLHAATNEDGYYCIDLVPAGTWDLEVRVDDYRTTYVRGIEITEGPSAVDIDLEGADFRFAAPWPNPAQGTAHFRLHLGETAAVRLQVHDLAGRLVHGWQDPQAEPGERLLVWDLRDRAGRPVPAGLYVVRFSTGDTRLAKMLAVVK